MRFSLITDLIAVAKADGSYSEEEKKNIERVSNYLDINHDQFAVLDEAVTKASSSEEAVQQIDKPNFIQSLGMQNQFSNAGFNMGSIGKSLFGFLGPMVLGGMAAKALSGRRTPGGGGLGGSLGGGLGGMLGGMLGSGGMSRGLPGGLGGGLGSLISGLNRSRGSRGMGGLLGRIL